MRLSVLLMAAALAACGQESGPPPPSEVVPVEVRVTARLDSLAARTSLYARHIPSGREIAIRADEPMNTLSVIKLAVMVVAFRDAEEGRLDLDARRRITPDDLRRGSGLLQTFSPGLEPTLRDLITQMIVTSDNTATDMMIREVGLNRVNEWLAGAGYVQTRLLRSTGDLFREVWIGADSANVAMTDREVFERGFPRDSLAFRRSFALEGDSARWLGRTTAREISRLLDDIQGGRVSSPEHAAEMMEILERQFYDSRLPRFLGSRARVAHKTGDWPPIAGNDVGILIYPGGPTILSIFTNQNTGDFMALEETLGRIALDLVDAWR
jgi:beta-lactamase class A